MLGGCGTHASCVHASRCLQCELVLGRSEWIYYYTALKRFCWSPITLQVSKPQRPEIPPIHQIAKHSLDHSSFSDSGLQECVTRSRHPKETTTGVNPTQQVIESTGCIQRDACGLAAGGGSQSHGSVALRHPTLQGSW